MKESASRTVVPGGCSRWDVVVIGGGPAGAMAAREIARGGASVLLIDRAHPPRFKPCGCCLNPRALAILASVGLGDLVERMGGVPYESLEVFARGRTSSLEVPGGRSLSREALDGALLDAGREVGVRTLFETRGSILPLPGSGSEASPESRSVSLVSRDGSRSTVEARIVLLATGLGGRVFEGEGDASRPVRRGSKVGAASILGSSEEVLPKGKVLMACGKGGYVGIAPVEPSIPRSGGDPARRRFRVAVAMALDSKALKAAGDPSRLAMKILRETDLRLPLSFSSGEFRGTPPFTGGSRERAGDRFFAIGDAAGFVEPFTGQGMEWALESGRQVAPLVLSSLASPRWSAGFEREWRSSYRRVIGSRQRACKAVAVGLRFPRLVAWALAAHSWRSSWWSPLIRHVSGSMGTAGAGGIR